MRISILIILSIFSCVDSKCEINSYIKAIQSIVKEYKRNDIKFDFLILESNNNKHLDFASAILKSVFEVENDNHTSIKLLRINHFKGLSIYLDRSTIIISEYSWMVTELNIRLRMTNSDYLKFQHLIIIKKPSSKIKLHSNIIEKSHPLKITSYIMYETFMICENNTLSLIKYDAFQRKNDKTCEGKFIEINKFNQSGNKWITNDFGLENLNHFNGCEILVTNMDNEMYESIHSLISMIEKDLNFTLKLIRGKIGEYLGPYHFDFATQAHGGAYYKNSLQIFVFKLYHIEFALVLTAGEPYTPYEKFLLPFDVGTWICCGVFFGGAFITILIINLTRNQRIQNTIYGRNVNFPAFNILVAFFGQPQSILPARNFARFILMMFIIFCLIIRTGYQGVQFDLIFKVSTSSMKFLMEVLKFIYQKI
jgi:hypothetical protein